MTKDQAKQLQKGDRLVTAFKLADGSTRPDRRYELEFNHLMFNGCISAWKTGKQGVRYRYYVHHDHVEVPKQENKNEECASEKPLDQSDQSNSSSNDRK